MLYNANLSQLQKKIESSKSNYLSVYFAGKPSVKIVFHIFQCLIAPNKKNLVNGKLSLVNGKL